MIDASREANLARFGNHSCDPNCDVVKWCVGSEVPSNPGLVLGLLPHNFFHLPSSQEPALITICGSTLCRVPGLGPFIIHSHCVCLICSWPCVQPRVGFFAINEIAVGDEITVDYAFQAFGRLQKCNCGTENCRGFLKPPIPDKACCAQHSIMHGFMLCA